MSTPNKKAGRLRSFLPQATRFLVLLVACYSIAALAVTIISTVISIALSAINWLNTTTTVSAFVTLMLMAMVMIISIILCIFLVVTAIWFALVIANICANFSGGHRKRPRSTGTTNGYAEVLEIRYHTSNDRLQSVL